MNPVLEELKKLLGPQYKPPQVFREYCAKLREGSRRGKLKRKVANRLVKVERARRRAAKRRHKKRVRKGRV